LSTARVAFRNLVTAAVSSKLSTSFIAWFAWKYIAPRSSS